MRRGERRRFLVGVGHGTCTCEGAAFEYIVNLEFELRARGSATTPRSPGSPMSTSLATSAWAACTSSVPATSIPSSIFNASLFAERGIDWITRAHVQQVEPGRVHYETLDGAEREQDFDFAMLLPPFSGVGLRAVDRTGADITDRLFMPNEFMRVDADYTAKPFERMDGTRLAADVPKSRVPQHLRGRDRVCAAPRDLPPAHQSERHTHRAGPAADRHAVGHDRQVGRAQHRRPDRRRRRTRPRRRRWRTWVPRASPRPERTRSGARPCP